MDGKMDGGAELWLDSEMQDLVSVSFLSSPSVLN